MEESGGVELSLSASVAITGTALINPNYHMGLSYVIPFITETRQRKGQIRIRLRSR